MHNKVLLLIVAFVSALVVNQVQAKSLQIQPDNQQQIDRIGGFVLYRVLNGKIEYLLLKKTAEDDWSPPKGNLDGQESEIDTAVRELKEETGLLVGDYDAYIQYKIYFEYITKDDELKKVNLWPAELSNFEKPIVLSEENEAYEWLEYHTASTTIKEQYLGGLTQADNIIRAHENLI